MTWFTKLRCWIGWHRRFDVINTFAAAQHIGCPDCGKQYGIHHGLRCVVPWDSELATIYECQGYEVQGPLAKWQEYRRARGRA